MASSLTLVAELFPKQKERIGRLFESDLVFRELCDDYEVCTEALVRQQAVRGLSEEYAALRLRLETELLRHLDERHP